MPDKHGSPAAASHSTQMTDTTDRFSHLPSKACCVQGGQQGNPPEVSSHIEALMVAVQHVHCATLHARLPVQLPQQQN